jgi:hypothetical protein
MIEVTPFYGKIVVFVVAVLIVYQWYRSIRSIGKSNYLSVYDCYCSVHDITTPGAAHAVDCPRYD